MHAAFADLYGLEVGLLAFCASDVVGGWGGNYILFVSTSITFAVNSIALAQVPSRSLQFPSLLLNVQLQHNFAQGYSTCTASHC